MKYFCLFVIGIFSIQNIDAQINTTGTGVVKGNITDSVSGSPIEYASIAVFAEKTDSLVAGTVSDEKGNFICEKIPNGTFILKVSFIGFFPFNSQPFSVDNKIQKIQLAPIKLSPSSSNLTEVNIEGVRKPFEQTFDKKIFLIDDKRAAGAETVLDVLKTLPAITVDQDGNVKFRGQTPNILVDNQPYNLLYPKLEMIPAANVDKIEFIDPSARYASSAGTINIKLKKPKENGLSGALFTSMATQDFKTPSQYYSGLNVNYLYKKTILFVNGYYGGGNNDNSYNQATSLNYNDTLFESTSYGATDGNSTWGSANAGMIYNFSKTSKLTFTWTPSQSKYKQTRLSDYSEISQNAIRELSSDSSYYNNDHLSNSFSLNFRNSPEDDSKEFSIKASYSDRPNSSNYGEEKRYSFFNFSTIDSIPLIENTASENNQVVSLELYKRKNIDSTGRWEVGFQSDLTNLSERKTYFLNETYVAAFSNEVTTYIYQSAIFGNIGYKIKKFKLDAGLRLAVAGGEMKNNVTIEGIDSLITVEKIYPMILPNITIGYEIKPFHELKVTYSFDLQPPDEDDLNPFVDKSEPRSWSSGNRDLMPYQFHRFTFGYLWAPQVISLSIDGFTNISNNYVEWVSEPISNYISMNKPYNIGRMRQTGVTISGSGMPANWFSANLSVDIFYAALYASNLSSELGNTTNEAEWTKTDDWAVMGNFYMNLTVKKKYIITTYMHYGGKNVSLGGYSKSSLYHGLFLTRKFLKNKLNASVGVQNLIEPKSGWSQTQEYLGRKETYDYVGSWNKRSFRIKLHYYFNKGDRGLMNNQGNPAGNQGQGGKAR
ncbi:MAG: TonB-dependent receptor [Bacteroidetes bacterium]|nr:TonB-dependent receptor [Bacteroidota bacterium]